jgi:hypothetical protein
MRACVQFRRRNAPIQVRRYLHVFLAQRIMTDSDLNLFADEGPPEAWERDFLEALVNEYAVIGKAARAAGVHPNAVEARRKASPRFDALYSAAMNMLDDALEYENVRRALEPSERPIFQRGKMVGVVQEFDTKHLEWLLERRYPEKYHIPTRIEFAGHNADAVAFKLRLGDQPPELEAGEDE